MTRSRSKSAESHYCNTMIDNTSEAIQILLTMRLELLFNLKYFIDHDYSSFIAETQQRLLSNKTALYRLLPPEDLHLIAENQNISGEILNLAQYLKHQSLCLNKPDVLQYIINMYSPPVSI